MRDYFEFTGPCDGVDDCALSEEAQSWIGAFLEKTQKLFSAQSDAFDEVGKKAKKTGVLQKPVFISHHNVGKAPIACRQREKI